MHRNLTIQDLVRRGMYIHVPGYLVSLLSEYDKALGRAYMSQAAPGYRFSYLLNIERPPLLNWKKILTTRLQFLRFFPTCQYSQRTYYLYARGRAYFSYMIRSYCLRLRFSLYATNKPAGPAPTQITRSGRGCECHCCLIL